MRRVARRLEGHANEERPMHASVEKRCCHRRDRCWGGVRWKRSEKPRIIDHDHDHDVAAPALGQAAAGESLLTPAEIDGVAGPHRNDDAGTADKLYGRSSVAARGVEWPDECVFAAGGWPAVKAE